MSNNTKSPIVEFVKVNKRFPGVHALKDVSLSIQTGSIHGLMGENGAGKSTLGKALAGIHAIDDGQILIDGKPASIVDPNSAMEYGIAMVHQELAFCENLSVAENLCLGQLPLKGNFVDNDKMRASAQTMLDSIGFKVDLDRQMGALTVGQQQMVQIASAVSRGASVLVFDEPTSSLSEPDAERLFALIKQLQTKGVTSIYVSHRMAEVFKLCDDISVLRDGEHVATKPASELDEHSLVSLMIGRELSSYESKSAIQPLGEEALRVEGLCLPGKFQDVSFSLKRGEILGFAGLVGSGRTEIAEVLFGLHPEATGKLWINGKPHLLPDSVQQARELGLGLAPEDRKRHGLILGMSCRSNITLPILASLSSNGWVDDEKEKKVSGSYFDKMRVKAPNMEVLAGSLSGGNQQKLVIARWLAANCGLLIVDEPTRGVDVGAKAEIHGLLDELACSGSGLMLISSELPELLMLSHRVVVMREGHMMGILTREQATQDAILRLMTGV
ncbi:MAG: sugar ABC transporter ATP-binding protein [Armatimonadota bacterium]